MSTTITVSNIFTIRDVGRMIFHEHGVVTVQVVKT